MALATYVTYAQHRFPTGPNKVPLQIPPHNEHSSTVKSCEDIGYSADCDDDFLEVFVFGIAAEV